MSNDQSNSQATSSTPYLTQSTRFFFCHFPLGYSSSDRAADWSGTIQMGG